MVLTEAEDIKKKWQEYTKLSKKDLHDPDNHNGVIIHLEPDIWECEVKWALGSITTNKASGGDEILVELFQILKDDTVEEAMIKTIPKMKKCKKAKWLSEEALQIAEKRREVKGKEKWKDIPMWMQSSKE